MVIWPGVSGGFTEKRLNHSFTKFLQREITISDGDLVRRDPSCTIFQTSIDLRRLKTFYWKRDNGPLWGSLCSCYSQQSRLGVICRVYTLEIYGIRSF